MIKVSVTLNGSPEEMASVLQLITGRSGEEVQLHEETLSLTDQAEDGHFDWTERKIRAVYWAISADCRSLLREIARSEDGLTVVMLRDKLGLDDERGVGGVLSSLGRQLNDPEYKGLPYPLEWAKYYRRKLIPIWQYIVAKLVEEQDSIVGDDN